MTNDEVKRGRGKPTLYTPTFCDMVKTFSQSGMSLTAFAGWLGVGRDTITKWQQAHPEFQDACNAAKAIRTYALEMQMLGSASGPVVNARRFALVNAAPDDWRNEQRVKLEGGDEDKPINIRQIELVAVPVLDTDADDDEPSS